MTPNMQHSPHFSFVPVSKKVKGKTVLTHFLIHPVLTTDNNLYGQLRRWNAVLIDQTRLRGKMPVPEAEAVYATSQGEKLDTAIEVLYHKKPSIICYCDECPHVVSLQSIMADLRKSYPTVSKSVVKATEDNLREVMLQSRLGEDIYGTQRYRCKWFKCRVLFFPKTSKAFPYCGVPHREANKRKWGWYLLPLKSGNLSKRFRKSCRTCDKTFWGTEKSSRCRSCLDAPKKRRRKRQKKSKKRAKGVVKGKRRRRCSRCNTLFMPKSRRQKYCGKCSKHGKR